MFETSYIEIDSTIYAKNLKFLKKAFAPRSEFCSVIKGNAYGHGAREMVTLAQKNAVSSFAVFNAHEALKVLEALNPQSRLIVMGDIDTPQLEWAIENKVEFFTSSLHHLKMALEAAKKVGRTAFIHLELETGMNRLGIEQKEYSSCLELILKNPEYLSPKGICTHFAGAESITNFVRVKKQIKKFESGCRHFAELDQSHLAKHAACSAAAVRFKKTRYDMVRIGILQYGFWPSQETFIDYIKDRANKESPIDRILSWKSRVMALKSVSIGEYVGYGTSFLAEDKKHLAIIPIGYSNGFSRNLSNHGRVLIRGKRAPVAGIVNMNAITVDVTDIANVAIGDEVVLIGYQGDQSISVASFSDFSNQLNYELLTRLPMDIPRFVK